MFDRLIESSARPPRRAGGTTVSMLVHGALVGVGLVVAAPSPQPPRATHQATRVLFIQPAPRSSIAPHLRRPDAATRQMSPVEQTWAAPTFAEPPVLPAPSLPTSPTEVGLPSGILNASPTLPGAPTGRGGGSTDDPREEYAVDRTPRLLGGAPVPSYPVALRRAGIEGRVIVQFVVDTLGRVEQENVEMLEVAHPLFATAVREALVRYRFTPGEAAGRRVRTRVQVPFDFRLSR